MTEPAPRPRPLDWSNGLRESANDHTLTEPSRNVSARQWEAVCQCIQKKLRGHEKDALDFYCGSGLFTADLAELIGGRALGVDTSRPLLSAATPTPGVRFAHSPDGRVPAGNNTMDVVLLNHALAGLRGRLLDRAVAEAMRVLKPDGLLVLAENTADLPDTEQWTYRDPAEYSAMFPGVKLRSMNKPVGGRPRLSVMIGRMMPPSERV